MLRIAKILIILMLSSKAYSQNVNVESLFTRKYIPCQDIRYNAQFLIPKFYKKNDLVTVNAIIKYWEKNCGASEEITRCKILLAIAKNDFKEALYDYNILKYLDLYKNITKNKDINYNTISAENDFESQSNESDSLYEFTVNLAKELLINEGILPIERFFVLIYSNNFNETFEILKTKDYEGTLLQELYLNELEYNKNKKKSYYGVMAGVWIPLGNLKVVGTHPFIGFRTSVKYKKLIIAPTLGFKAGGSTNKYQVFKNDSVYDTDHFFGVYIGIDFDFEMFKIKNSSFSLIGGVASDLFDALSADDPNSDDDIVKTINSLNLNFGLGYRLFINQSKFIGLEFKYNIVDFKNNLGTNLSGDALSINLIYGF